MTTAGPHLIALCSPAMGSGKSTVASHLCLYHGFTVLKFAGPLKAMTRAFLLEAGLSPDDIWDFVDGSRKEEVIPGVPGGVSVLRAAGAMVTAFLRELDLPDDRIDAMRGGELSEMPIPGVPGGIHTARFEWLLREFLWFNIVSPTTPITSRRFQQLLGTEFGRDLIHPNLWVEITMGRARQLRAAGKSVVIDDMRFPNELAGVIMADGLPIRVVRPATEVTTPGHASEGALDRTGMFEIHNDGDLERLRALVDRAISHL